MPNHCENTLTLKSPKEDLSAFREAARSTAKPLEIENFIPMPDNVRNSNGDTIQWRDWVLHNWGTKWGAYDFDEIQETEDTLAYVFITAWGPFNQHAMKVMSSRFP